LARDL